MNNKKHLAEEIKRLRAYYNLSQRDLASKTGITQSDISKLERGLANPSVDTLSRLAEAVGATVNIEFIYKDDEIEFVVENWGKVKDEIIVASTEATRLVKGAMKEDVVKVVLFGSCARGDNTEDSDVDIALITGSDRLEVKKYNNVLAEISTAIMDKYTQIVNFVCLPAEEFEEKKSWYPYFMNIDKEGIVLYAR